MSSLIFDRCSAGDHITVKQVWSTASAVPPEACEVHSFEEICFVFPRLVNGCSFPIHTLKHRLGRTEVDWLNIHRKTQVVWGVIFLIFIVLSLSRLHCDIAIETCWYMQLSDTVRGLSAFYWLLSIHCRMQQLLLAQWKKKKKGIYSLPPCIAAIQTGELQNLT